MNKFVRGYWYALLLGFIACVFYGIFVGRTSFDVGGRRSFTLIDDAMISMRYAENVSNGYGLVWNPGEARVEGFTNLGWTLYMALLQTLPVVGAFTPLLVMVTSAILLLGNSVLAFKLVRAIAPRSPYAPLIASTITVFYFPLVFWSLRGMELGLTTFLISLLTLWVIDPGNPAAPARAWQVALLAFLAIVVRVDTILQITLIVCYVAYTRLRHPETRSVSLFPILFLSILAIVGVSLFQLAYFGSALPNTYYLKIGGIPLVERASVGVQVMAAYALRDILPPLFVVVAWLLMIKASRRPVGMLFLGLFAVQCAYSIYVGGDYAEPLNAPQVDAANRFISQGMPFLIVLFAVAADQLVAELSGRSVANAHATRRASGIIAAGIAVAALMIMSGKPWAEWVVHNAPLLDSDISRVETGIYIRDHTDAAAVVAAHAVGQISFYSNRRVIDLLGLSDPVVAKGPPVAPFRPGHNKWNYEYSIGSLKPDVIADEWGQLARFLAHEPEYLRLDNGIWVRKNSPHVYLQSLAH